MEQTNRTTPRSQTGRMSTPRLWTDVDFGKVIFNEAKRNQNGGINVDVSYNGDNGPERLWIQGPKMRIPFGVTSNDMFNDRNPSRSPNFTLDLALSGLRAGDTNMASFEKFCNDWDDMVVTAALQKSVTWFGKERSEQTIRELIKPLIKQPKDLKYDPTVKVKLPKRYGKWDFVVYDQTTSVVDVDDSMIIGNEAIPIFEMKYVWFVGNQFGTSLEGKQFQCFVKEEIKDFIIVQNPNDATPTDVMME